MSLSTNCDPVTRNKHTNLAASIFMQGLLSALQTISASRICVQKEVELNMELPDRKEKKRPLRRFMDVVVGETEKHARH